MTDNLTAQTYVARALLRAGLVEADPVGYALREWDVSYQEVALYLPLLAENPFFVEHHIAVRVVEFLAALGSDETLILSNN